VPKPKKKEGNKHQKHQETTHKEETIPFFQKEAPHLPETILKTIIAIQIRSKNN